MREITSEEQVILEVCRMTRKTPVLKRIDKKFSIGRLKVHIELRTSKNLWGRFGGGWNWKLGFQASRSTIILSLLVFTIRLNVVRPPNDP